MCSTSRIVALAVLVALAVPCRAQSLKIEGPMTSPPYKLLVFTATGQPAKSAVEWDVVPDLGPDAIEVPDGRLLLVAPPGTYTVKCRASWVVDGEIRTERAKLVLVVGGGVPPPKPPDVPPVPPVPKSAIPAAIGKLRLGNKGCTASAVYPRRADGRWDVVSANHCTDRIGEQGTLTLLDGRQIAVRVVVKDPKADVSWLVTDDASLADLPYSVVSATDVPPGTPVFQQGYGYIRPGVRKDGVAVVSTTPKMSAFTIPVSNGDSGGGIYRADNLELVSVVCCGTIGPNAGRVYGGSATSINALRPRGAGDFAPPEVQRPPIITEEVVPIPIGCGHHSADLSACGRRPRPFPPFFMPFGRCRLPRAD